MKNILKSVIVMVAVLSTVAGATSAAFTAQATITGNTFSTGNAALRLWNNLADINAGVTQYLENTVEFLNIYPKWTQDYLAKVQNTGTVPLKLSIVASPMAADAALSPHITAQVWLWTDTNGDGTADGADGYALVNTKTVAEWEALGSTGIVLPGTLNAATTQGILFRFTADDLNDTLQDHTMTYDFVINGTTP